MADFCTKCSIEMFGPTVEPDINIEEIIRELKPNYYKPVLCEGCTMSAIGKDEKGQAFIAIPVEDDENSVEWIPYEQWEANYKGLMIPTNEEDGEENNS